MPDWTKPMNHTYEYYLVDPGTWKDVRLLTMVTSCTIDRDLEAETRGSAMIDVDELIEECYIRVYLITEQGGIKEKIPLATVLVQTPSSAFDGKKETTSLDAYTPLLELKENPPPIGYFIAKDSNIMDEAYRLTREHSRAPVVATTNKLTIPYDFVAETSDTWLSYLASFIGNANYIYGLDEMGRTLFEPFQDMASLQPVWTFTDDNSSILYPDLTTDRDLYGIPNAIEVIYSDGSDYFYSKVVNDDPNSPISTVNRGREIIFRDTEPEVAGVQSQKTIDEYAEKKLQQLSTLAFTITYSHGYCPVRIGDCVRLNYEKAKLVNVKAKVITQSIQCKPGCPVKETAIFAKKFWR